MLRPKATVHNTVATYLHNLRWPGHLNRSETLDRMMVILPPKEGLAKGTCLIYSALKPLRVSIYHPRKLHQQRSDHKPPRVGKYLRWPPTNHSTELDSIQTQWKRLFDELALLAYNLVSSRGKIRRCPSTLSGGTHSYPRSVIVLRHLLHLNTYYRKFAPWKLLNFAPFRDENYIAICCTRKKTWTKREATNAVQG